MTRAAYAVDLTIQLNNKRCKELKKIPDYGKNHDFVYLVNRDTKFETNKNDDMIRHISFFVRLF